MRVRQALPSDISTIVRIVKAAYKKYVPHMARPPGPMLDDYAQRIANDEAFVATDTESISGVIILIEAADHLLLDNVAVDPAMQGQRIGRHLVDFAEAEARRRGYSEIRLYTHVVMDANVAYYESLGWEETHRGEQNGYARIFMRKRLV